MKKQCSLILLCLLTALLALASCKAGDPADTQIDDPVSTESVGGELAEAEAFSDLNEIKQALLQFEEVPQHRIEELRQKYPQYFDLGDFKGLEVYAWVSESVVYCGVLPGTNRMKTTEELTELKANGATVEEMRLILSAYGIPKEAVSVLSLDALLKYMP